MTVTKVEGFCDSKFSKLGDIFSKAIKSGFDDGAALSLEIENRLVLCLGLLYKPMACTV